MKKNNKKALRDHNHLFRNELVLNIKKADQASTVRWQDIGDSGSIRLSIFPMFAMMLFTLLSAFVVRFIRKERQSTTYAAITVSLLNSFVPYVAKRLTDLESHSTERKKQVSLYVKLVAFRLINTTMLISFITVSDFYEYSYFISF